MEKELIQELKYDLDREKDIEKQIDLIVMASDMLCPETQQDAWEFFRTELNRALKGNQHADPFLMFQTDLAKH